MNGCKKMKHKAKKTDSKHSINAEQLLEKDNRTVLEFVDGMKNKNEKEKVLKGLISHLENCLLDRDAGKSSPKLIEQLKIKLNEIIKDGRGYKTKSLEEKVWWKGSEPQLVYFFELLFNVNLIDKSQYDNRFALIENNFKNKYGNAFDNKQLARATQNMINSKNKGKPKKTDADEIEDVLREIREILQGQTN